MAQKEYDEELQYILNTAVKNGYRTKDVQKLLQRHRRKSKLREYTKLSLIKDEEKFSYLTLPFYPELTNKLEQKLHKYGIKIAYTSNGNLRDILGTAKEKTPNEDKSGVYKIRCQDGCSKYYIGKTIRTLKERRKEHQDHVKYKRPHLSAMAKHCVEANHIMGDIALIDEIRQEWKAETMENFYICKYATPDLVNLDLKEIKNTPLIQMVKLPQLK